MQHVIVCVIVGVLLQWNNVESRPATTDLAATYAELHPNTGFTEECQELEVEDSDNEISPLNAVSNAKYKWPQRTAYYAIQSGYTSSQISQIKAAIADIEKLTAVNGQSCIKILPRSTQTDYISVENYSGCSSYVGRIGGKQRLSLTSNCFSTRGTIMHEFLHALGFHHEQKRTDRDGYVTINWKNIKAGAEGNFEKLGADVITLLGTKYDYGSVLHYNAYSFAINPSIPTIIPRDSKAEIGQRVTLSRLDIERVQIHYGCITAADSVFFKHLSQ